MFLANKKKLQAFNLLIDKPDPKMELSYWEYKTWLSQVDFTVVGSGIVGLSTAINLKLRYPKAKVLVLEKGLLPQGASTKNAGFACFGSISEVLSDLKGHTEEEVVQLVKQRWDGINKLRALLGDKALGYQPWGGYELFLNHQQELYDNCLQQLARVNKLLYSIFKQNAFITAENSFAFRGIHPHLVYHQLEGQIDTGSMMQCLLNLARTKGVLILNAVTVNGIADLADHVVVNTDQFQLHTHKLFLATNGFAQQFMGTIVRPARAQVLVTKPIPNLSIKGTFHVEEGYYYFRNIADRILFGGGRNLDFKTEETTVFGQTDVVQNSLERILKETILPETSFEIDRRWSGIMGVGQQKKPIVEQVSNNVYCGVRMGGMGVAIGSQIGEELVGLL